MRGNEKLTSKARLNHLAKNLRRSQTQAELNLWWALRSRQIEGAKFRRQFPISKYIVDFICFEANLVIEVDGGQHALQADEDRVRTQFLESKGMKVLRFTNLDVLNNLEGAVFLIGEQLATQRRHSPST